MKSFSWIGISFLLLLLFQLLLVQTKQPPKEKQSESSKHTENIKEPMKTPEQQTTGKKTAPQTAEQSYIKSAKKSEPNNVQSESVPINKVERKTEEQLDAKPNGKVPGKQPVDKTSEPISSTKLKAESLKDMKSEPTEKPKASPVKESQKKSDKNSPPESVEKSQEESLLEQEPATPPSLKQEKTPDETTKHKSERNSPGREPFHIAIFSACDSRISATKPITYTLLNKISNPGKYRITYVIGSQCQDVAGDLGADFYDTGFWYYPSPKTSSNGFDFFNNLTTSSIRYSYNSMDSMIKADRPDLVLAECFGVGAATAAEANDVPFAYIWTPALPHISTWRKGHNLTIGLTMDYVPNEERPDWYFKLHTYLFHSIYISYINIFGEQAIDELRAIREGLGLGMFDNFEHAVNSFPSISLAGQPMTQMTDTPPHLMVAGILPLPPDTSVVSEDINTFLANSDKPILYVALGTFFAYSDKLFSEIKEVLENQDKFNVLWSHKFYDDSKFPVKNGNQMIIKKRMPQRHILKHEKVKVFFTHCGMSSTTEGVTAGVAFITSPQGRDQFYIEDLMRRANMSIPLGKFPTSQSVSAAVEKVYDNLEFYTSNVKKAYQKLRVGSEEKLEQFIDSLIRKRHSTRFDLEYSNFWSYNQAMTFIGGLLLLILGTFASMVVIAILVVKSLLFALFRLNKKQKVN